MTMIKTGIPLPSSISDKALSFEDFVDCTRDVANSGKIQTSGSITLYDLAIIWTMDSLITVLGSGVKVSLEQIWYALRAFLGPDKAEELEGSVGEEIIIHGGFKK